MSAYYLVFEERIAEQLHPSVADFAPAATRTTTKPAVGGVDRIMKTKIDLVMSACQKQGDEGKLTLGGNSHTFRLAGGSERPNPEQLSMNAPTKSEMYLLE